MTDVDDKLIARLKELHDEAGAAMARGEAAKVIDLCEEMGRIIRQQRPECVTEPHMIAFREKLRDSEDMSSATKARLLAAFGFDRTLQ
jgi:hypothetical protein